MNPATSRLEPRQQRLALIAWPVMLSVSLLPDILFQELTGSRPAWLFGAKLVLLAILLLASLFWRVLRPLRLYFGVLLALYLVEWGVNRFYEALNYQDWFAGANSFVQQVGPGQVTGTTAAVLMALIMLAALGRFDRFFLVKGRLDAPAQPIPFILTRPPSWRILGPAIAGAMCLGLVAFVFVFGRPPRRNRWRRCCRCCLWCCFSRPVTPLARRCSTARLGWPRSKVRSALRKRYYSPPPSSASRITTACPTASWGASWLSSPAG